MEAGDVEKRRERETAALIIGRIAIHRFPTPLFYFFSSVTAYFTQKSDFWMSFIASLFGLVSRAPTRIWQQVNSQLLLIWQGIWWYVCRDFVMHLQLYAQPFVCSGLSLYVPISVHVCRHLINSKLWLTLMVYQNMKSSLCYTVTLTRVNSIGIETIFLI